MLHAMREVEAEQTQVIAIEETDARRGCPGILRGLV